MMMSIGTEESILARLEKGFQEQQSAFQNTRDDVNALKAGYSVIQRDIMSLANSVEKLVSRFEDNNKTNWPMLALMAGLLPVLIGGMAFFMTSFTSNAVAPIHSETMQNQTALKGLTDQVKEIVTTEIGRGRDISSLSQSASTNTEIITRMSDRQRTLEDMLSKSAAADENSRVDRQQINARLQKLELEMTTEVTDRRTQTAENKVQIAEIEQQFHAVSNLDNLRAAQQERMNSMLWEKSHPGERYPNGTFFPTSLFQGVGQSGQPLSP